METLELIKEFCKKKGWENNLDERSEEAVDILLDFGKEVWRNPFVDTHRWYDIQDRVIEFCGHFFMYDHVTTKGDTDLSDIDMDYTLSSFTRVYPHTRQIIETYFTTEAG